VLADLIECRSIVRRSTKTLARDRRPRNSPNAETDPLGWSPTVSFGLRCGRREREVVSVWKRRSLASQRRMDENLALGRGCLLARAHPMTGQSSRVKPRRCPARHVRPVVQCRSISSLEQGNPSRAPARETRPKAARSEEAFFPRFDEMSRVPIRHSSFAGCLEKHLVVRLAVSAVHRATSGTGSLASIAPELSRDSVERVWVARSSREGRGSRWWSLRRRRRE
jgi:hypothetical protein